MNKQKHLTLTSRITIETMLNKGDSFKSIGRFLNKDCTTISKEVKNHICFEKSGAYGRAFNDCRLAFLHQCSAQMVCRECSFRKGRLCWSCGKCTSSCILYEKYICPRLSRPPYVCNGCPSRNKCSLEKHLYQASYAQKEYELVRSESRAGFALSPTELKQMDDIVSPLLIKGQSLHHIAVHHADELMKSERTLYAYVNNGLFTARNLDMPRTVRMRPRKNVSRNLKVDKACREGRDFSCFQAYTKEHPRKLIEAAAEDLAETVLLQYPLLKGVTLELKKPWAPVGLPLETVSVKITRFWHTAYLALGSNLGDKEGYLNQAVKELDSAKDCQVEKVSSYLVTEPYGGVEQDDFLNACLKLKTLLSPQELLERLHEIEQNAHRERLVHWGPRTLDLDILLYDDEVLETEDLIIPHVEMQLRDFVLKPMCEIAPYKRHPLLGKTMTQLLCELEEKG